MKLQAQSSRELRESLQKASKCIDPRNAILALSDVLLMKNKSGNLCFVSGNGDAQLTIPAPLEEVDGTLDKPIQLPIASMLSFVSTLPECVLTLCFDEGKLRFELQYCIRDSHSDQVSQVKNGKASLPFATGDAYPLMNIDNLDSDAIHITLPMSVFSSALQAASAFISSDELRPQLSCMYIDVREDLSSVVFVSTNSKVLFRRIYSNDEKQGGGNFYVSGTPSGISISNRQFRPLSVFDHCETIDIVSNRNLARMTSGDYEFTCRLVEGKYPNYSSAIPSSNPFSIVVDKREILTVLKRVSLFSSNSTNSVVLTKRQLFVNITSEDEDMGRSACDQVLVMDGACEDGFKIAFNAHSLSTCLQAIPSDTVRISLTTYDRAAVLTADTPSADTTAICMPLQLN